MVHQYKLNGYNIVIDGNSGAVHSVDPLAYDIIERYERTSKENIKKEMLLKYENEEGVDGEEIEAIFDDIKELIDAGQLYSKDVFADRGKDFKKRQSVLKAMCLHVAHDCNMDCTYCFAGKGVYNGEKSIMDLDTGKKALDFLFKESKGRKNLEVDFFGGEPLLDFDVVKELVAYGRSIEKGGEKRFRFTLTTNGLLLNDEVIRFLNKEMSNVVISLDGRKATNDRVRRTQVGGGTYDLVINKFKKLADSRSQKDYYLRGTYTGYNKEFCDDIIHMADMGFKELSAEPVVAPADAPYALKNEDLPVLFKEYEKLATEMIRRKKAGRGFNFYHYNVDLQGGPCIIKRISGCGVGSEYLAVTPSGELYPCHQFVGDKKFLLGDLDSGIINGEIIEQFKGCNVYSHEECRNCFAKLYCSGGCAANAYHGTGSVTGVYGLGCELQKKRIECAIMIQVASADYSEDVVDS